MIVSFSIKISSFKETKCLASTSKIANNIIHRIDTMMAFLTLLNEKQNFYLELKRIFKNCSF
jgi:hypothetical protein